MIVLKSLVSPPLRLETWKIEQNPVKIFEYAITKLWSDQVNQILLVTEPGDFKGGKNEVFFINHSN